MLVELLTGLLIGLMVTLTALGTLAFMQASTVVQSEAFRLQQKIDVAMQTIGQQLRQAGAVELQPALNGTAVSFSSAFDGHAGSGHAVYGEDGRGHAADVLLVSHQDGADTRDCLGNRPDAEQSGIRVDSRFSVAAGVLRCLGAHRGTGSQAIADRVEDFQVRYGLRTDSTSGPRFRFVDAASVGTGWADVRAVQVCLQIASERSLQPTPAANLLDCHGGTIPADGRLRRVAQATFTLRNLPL